MKNYKKYLLYIIIFIYGYFNINDILLQNFLLKYTILYQHKNIILIYNHLLNGFLYIFLLISAYKDYKYKEIEDNYTIPILIIGLLHFYNIQEMAFIALFLLSIRYIGALLLQKEVIGEADIIIYLGLGGIYSYKDIIGIFILSSILGVIFAIYKYLIKDKEWKYVPMLPMILISTFLINLNFFNQLIALLKG